MCVCETERERDREREGEGEREILEIGKAFYRINIEIAV